MSESITSLIKAKVDSDDFTLPVFSPIAMEIRQAIDNDATIGEIELLILKDQSLAAETLRLANSALFAGLARQKTIQQALVRLGVKRVFNFVMLASQQQVFTARTAFLNDMMKAMSEQSAASATACRWVAMKCGYGDIAEDAFLAGLLHDLGSLVVLKAVDEITSSGELEDLSTDVIADVIDSLHAEYGFRVMQSWELPAEYAEIARDHHQPAKSADNALLHIVRLVDAACCKVGIGMVHNPDLPLEALEETVFLGIKDVHLAELEMELEDSADGLDADADADEEALTAA